MRRRPLLAGMLAFLATFAPISALAAVTSYTNATLFGLDTGATIVATFNAKAFGSTAAFTEGGVHFSAPGNNLYCVDGRVPLSNTNPTPTTMGLTGTGGDVIDLTPPAGIRAVGFDTITNAYAAPTVTVYAPDNSLLATFTLTQARNTLGFFGVVSSSDIGRVRWTAVNGETQNTVLDNIRIDSPAVPTLGTTWGRLKQLYR